VVLYWLLKKIILGPLLTVVYRPTIKGLEHVPATGPAILASNHLSFSDSFFLPLLVPRRITFLAKSDYFTGRGLKGRLTAGFFRGLGQVPIDRTGGRASDAALTTGLRVLNRGELLGIYPEGTRSPDGRLYRGKTGIARMALEAGVPVLPVAMIGTDEVQPIGRVIPKLGRPRVIIGSPLDFSRYEGMSADRFVLRSITDEIMYDLMKISGQEYVDVYAATMKERLAAAKRAKPVPGGPEGEALDGPVDDPSTPGATALGNGSAAGQPVPLLTDLPEVPDAPDASELPAAEVADAESGESGSRP
jgi:1-acyl-sn-glycerol-3-phosphate acyltransferase